MSPDEINPGSVIPLLRRILSSAGVPGVDEYSSHSLRRGFATWANANGWELRALMDYVGWKNVGSASRYVDTTDPYHRELLERLVSTTAPEIPT